MKPVLAIALNPTIDVASQARRVQPTFKIRTRNQQVYPGGGGTNVARVIAELGGSAELAYLAGGATGPVFEGLLAGTGITLHGFPMQGAVRISVTIFEEETGFEYRAVPEGPEVTGAELEPVFDLVRSVRQGYIVASGSLPRGCPSDAYARMAMIAEANGVPFVLDTSGEALTQTLEKAKVFLLKPSIGELSAHAGRKLDEDGAVEVASAIVESGAAENIAVTMGRDGAFLASRDGVIRRPPVHVKTQSAVGAGDSFLAAMVFRLASGAAMQEAFEYGLAAGAAAAMTPGTVLCRKADVERLYATMLER